MFLVFFICISNFYEAIDDVHGCAHFGGEFIHLFTFPELSSFPERFIHFWSQLRYTRRQQRPTKTLVTCCIIGEGSMIYASIKIQNFTSTFNISISRSRSTMYTIALLLVNRHSEILYLLCIFLVSWLIHTFLDIYEETPVVTGCIVC